MVPDIVDGCKNKVSRNEELNPGPSIYKNAALPTELLRHMEPLGQNRTGLIGFAIRDSAIEIQGPMVGKSDLNTQPPLYQSGDLTN